MTRNDRKIKVMVVKQNRLRLRLERKRKYQWNIEACVEFQALSRNKYMHIKDFLFLKAQNSKIQIGHTLFVCMRLILPPFASALKCISSLSPFHTFVPCYKHAKFKTKRWVHSKAEGWCFLDFKCGFRS